MTPAFNYNLNLEKEEEEESCEALCTNQNNLLRWRYFWIKVSVRRARRRGKLASRRNKKREISQTLLSINLHFSVCAALNCCPLSLLIKDDNWRLFHKDRFGTF